MTTPAPLTAVTASADVADPDELVPTWIRMWDSDLDAAPSLLTVDIRPHVARIDGVSDDRGPEALTSWIVAIRRLVPDLRFDLEVGPFIDGEVVVLRWTASGTTRADGPVRRVRPPRCASASPTSCASRPHASPSTGSAPTCTCCPPSSASSPADHSPTGDRTA